jgi:hypothetical protein
MKKTFLTLITLLAAFQFCYAQWVNGTGIIYTASDKIGIGTASPTVKLDVIGTANFSTPTGGYTISLGGSGGDYGSIGYNQQYGNTSGAYTYKVNDYASFLKFFLGGFDFFTAPIGTAGTAVSYTNVMRITQTGNVGIGTSNPDEKLTVNGKIHSKEVKVDVSIPVPDYVFDVDYKLTDLDALKVYINKNHHLPEIPPAAQMEKEGINLSDMNMKLLKKVEELTLYIIQKDEQLKDQEKINRLNQEQIDELKKQLNTISKSLLSK